MDEKSFNMALDAYSGALKAYAYGICADMQTAEDAVQETFMRYLECGGGVRNVRPWLYRVCRNRLIDKFKGAPPRAEGGDALEAVAEERPHPAEEIQKEELYAELFRCMGRLKASEAEIISLKYFSGMSYAEMAETLQTTENNVGVRLKRSVDSLKRLMLENGGKKFK